MVNTTTADGAPAAKLAASIPDTRVVATVNSYKPSNPMAGLTVDSTPQQTLGPTQCRVKMMYAPVNPSDVNVLEGTYLIQPETLPAVMGFEGSGEVCEVGADVKTLSIGDHVYGSAFNWGSWAQYATSEANALQAVSKDADMQMAALMSVNPPTAYGLLYGAQEGDWVVQNAGNSSMGLSVIQVAKRRGIKTISVVRRPEVEADMIAHGADAVVVYTGKSYVAMRRVLAKIKQITNGEPIKLAFNAVCGQSGELLAKCLAHGGKMLTYGAMSNDPMQVNGAALVFQDLSYEGFHLRKFCSSVEPREIQIMYSWLTAFLDSGDFKPAHVKKVYPLSDVKQAVADSFEGKGVGKVLIKCDA